MSKTPTEKKKGVGKVEAARSVVKSAAKAVFGSDADKFRRQMDEFFQNKFAVHVKDCNVQEAAISAMRFLRAFVSRWDVYESGKPNYRRPAWSFRELQSFASKMCHALGMPDVKVKLPLVEGKVLGILGPAFLAVKPADGVSTSVAKAVVDFFYDQARRSSRFAPGKNEDEAKSLWGGICIDVNDKERREQLSRLRDLLVKYIDYLAVGGSQLFIDDAMENDAMARAKNSREAFLARVAGEAPATNQMDKFVAEYPNVWRDCRFLISVDSALTYSEERDKRIQRRAVHCLVAFLKRVSLGGEYVLSRYIDYVCPSILLLSRQVLDEKHTGRDWVEFWEDAKEIFK